MSQINSIKELLARPEIKPMVLAKKLIEESKIHELQRKNMRPIDKFLFDPLNNILHLKEYIYKTLVADPILSPEVIGCSGDLASIGDDYFDFDADSLKDVHNLELDKEKN
jgi:hypothetical protein